MKNFAPRPYRLSLAASALALLGVVCLYPTASFKYPGTSPHAPASAPQAAGDGARQEPPRGDASAPHGLDAGDAYGKLPLRFEANRGQTDPRVKFLSRGGGYNLFLTPTEAVLALNKGAGPPALVRARLRGSNPKAEVRGAERLPGFTNYFVGDDPARWRVNVPTYGKVHYEDVYPGIDLVYYGNQGRLEYDFVVAPGADPGDVSLKLEAAGGLRLNEGGDLVVSTEGGELRLLRPITYQEAGGARQVVESRYVLTEGGRVGFEVAAYDKRRPLVIDPVIEYATFLGGGEDDRGLGIAVDAHGQAYVAGLTTSADFNASGALGGAADAFVVKLNAEGSSVLWSTYFGGGGTDQARAVALDAQGNAYITGITDSHDLPTTPGAFQPGKGSTNSFLDAFVAKLSADGTALAYCTYLGGWRPDEGDAIAVDAAGSAYVTGSTGSYDTGNASFRPFPTTPGAFQNDFPYKTEGGGNSAAFVTKLSPAGDSAAYSTFLGGLGNDAGSAFGDVDPDDLGFGIAVDPAGHAVVTGRTESERFPVLNAAQPAAGGGLSDAFVTKLNPAGTGLVFSTFLGGAGEENRSVGAVAADAAGNVYLTGATNSTDFPVAGALQPAYGGNPENEAFVVKLDGAGATVFSTYLGSNNFKRGFGIAADRASNVYVTGTNLLRKLRADGAALVYSQTLNGEGHAVALDSRDNVYVTGITTTTTAAAKCTPGNFCPTAGAAQPDPRGGTREAFVVKIAADNRAPFADAGRDQTLQAVRGGTAVTLDGSASHDPDGDQLSFEWRDAGGNVVGTTASLNLTLGLGTHAFALTVSDGRGGVGSDTTAVTVEDKTPPVLNLPEDITVVAAGATGANVSYEATAADDVDGILTPACSPAPGLFDIGAHAVVCTVTDSSGNAAAGAFDITVLSARNPTRNKYIDFERYPGEDGFYGTGDEGEACAEHGDEILDRYARMGVTFRLTDGNSPVIVLKNSPFIPGSRHVLKPMNKTDFDARAGDQSRLKDFDILLDEDVRRVKISALDADEPWELLAYNGQGVRVARVSRDAGGGTSVRSLEVKSDAEKGYIRRVRVNIRTSGESCCEAGPEFFDLLEIEPVAPPERTNTRFIDFETAPGPDGVLNTADDTATEAGQSISDQYEREGVTFKLSDGTAPIIREPGFAFKDSPRALYPVSDPAGSQTRMRNLEMTFDAPVSRVKFYAIDADEAWRVQVFSRAGALIYNNSYAERDNNNPFAVEFRVDPCSSPDDLIGRVLIIPTKSSECCHSGPEFYDLLEFDVIDLAAPTTTATPDDDSWHKSDVSVTLTARDGGGNGVANIFYSLNGGPQLSGGNPTTFIVTSEGVNAVSYFATDGANRETPKTLTVKIDKTAPVLAATATAGGEPYSPNTPTNRDVTVTFDCSDAVSGVASVSLPVTVSAGGLSQSVGGVCRDNAGNETAAVFEGINIDKTAPAVSVPAGPLVFEAEGPTGNVVEYSATASDAADGALPLSCLPASGSRFALGDTTVTCQATDAHGNTASAAFIVRVKDETAPTLTLPSPPTAEATGPSGAAVNYAASAEDRVEGAVAVSCSRASGSTFPIGTTTVTCSASDARGNTATGSFSVTVRDTTAPSLLIPDDIVAEATGPAGGGVSYSASATDLVDGPVAVSCAPASGGTFALGTTTVTCTASDANHNTTARSFSVTVRDTTAPVISNVPASFTLEAAGPNGAAASWTSPTAHDLVDGALEVSCAPASGSTFPIGVTHVLCGAADSRGNAASAGFDVTVRDTTAPSLVVPADIIAEATGPAGAAVSYSASATDLVDGPVAVGCVPAPGSTFAFGTTTVTCSASDARGNTAARSFSVTVHDTTAPVLSVPGNLVVNATGPAGAVVSYAATATDVADPAPALGCVPAAGGLFPVGTSSVTCTARDASGNSASAVFLVTVKGAGDQLADLIALVNGLGLPEGLTNSLVTKLEHARDAFDAGKMNPACQTLGAFINEVEAKRGKELTDAQADQLVGDVERIRAVMGCP